VQHHGGDSRIDGGFATTVLRADGAWPQDRRVAEWVERTLSARSVVTFQRK
jgi:hypothetical protein